MKVLVIDDDPVTCEILGETIAAVGFTVRCVSNGHAAIDVMKTEKFPLVVCDWEMPGIDGLAFCKWLRSGELKKSTYIIMLTARQGMAHTADGIASGADTFLSKPCRPTIIIDHLRLGGRLLTAPKQPEPNWSDNRRGRFISPR